MVTFQKIANINAETVVSRCKDLKILNDLLGNSSNPLHWSLPNEKVKPTAAWSVDWNTRDDAMLLVGAWRHGFGNWEMIQADPELGLRGKFFLENVKSTKVKVDSKSIPNAIHLVRRGDYLLKVLVSLHRRIPLFSSRSLMS